MVQSTQYRLGLIVPSANTTVETELAEMFRRREAMRPERFTLHSARVRMADVPPPAFAAMDAQSDRCAVELADADCDVLVYACLFAVMARGNGAPVTASRRLSEAASVERHRPVVTSAGALAVGITALGARRVAMITPYLPALTSRVVDYLADQGIGVVDAISLGITDSQRVGRLDPAHLVRLADQLDLRDADAILLSACVQMPSLPAIGQVEAYTGLPVLSATTATAYRILRTLRLEPVIPHAGRLLAGGAVRHRTRHAEPDAPAQLAG